MKVLLADDHTIVREGLKKLLSGNSAIAIIEEVDDGQKAEKMILANNYDIVILDISMPHKTGLEILTTLKQQKNKTKILILSMHPEEQYAIKALKLGAKGYVTKNSAAEELLIGIENVKNGQIYVSPSILEKIIDSLNHDEVEIQPHYKLSAREMNVMCLIAEGKSLSDIAEELFVSAKTISTYRSRILQKMKMEKNAELTSYCIHNKLIEI